MEIKKVSCGQMKSYLRCKKVRTAIKRAKKLLEARAESEGIWENFGQEEVRKIREHFVDDTDYSRGMNLVRFEIDAFLEWCMSYEGK